MIRRWTTRGGRYAITFDGETLEEFTRGRSSRRKVGATLADVEKTIALAAAIDGIRYREIPPAELAEQITAAWHGGELSAESLRAALAMTEEEYARWVTTGQLGDHDE